MTGSPLCAPSVVPLIILSRGGWVEGGSRVGFGGRKGVNLGGVRGRKRALEGLASGLPATFSNSIKKLLPRVRPSVVLRIHDYNFLLRKLQKPCHALILKDAFATIWEFGRLATKKVRAQV